MNLIIFKEKYKIGTCSYIFLMCYGVFRIFSELFREPDAQLGYLFNIFSMGTLLSLLMIIFSAVIFFYNKKNEIKS